MTSSASIGSVEIARLRVIEAEAQRVREAAEADCLLLEMELGHLFDIDAVASIITHGPVESVRNLEFRGQRLAGLLSWNGRTPTISYEYYDPPARQRFSIAHELGHYFLHASGESCPVACAAIDFDLDPQLEQARAELLSQRVDIEAEADAFAAAFLVPVEAFRNDLQRYGFCAAFLAQRYGISDAAIRRRVRVLERLATPCD